MIKNSTEEKKDKYHLTMKVNGDVFEIETTDLPKAILSFAPPVVKTKVLFTIKKGELVCEKQLFVRKARMVFTNRIFMVAFIKQLIFKQYV